MLHELARLIPKEFRDKIIEENMIYKAIASANDRHMRILFSIWTNYIDPNGDSDMGCPYCINNVLSNFKSLEPVLIELHKEEQILDEL